MDWTLRTLKEVHVVAEWEAIFQFGPQFVGDCNNADRQSL
jgi:hypothetical protein